MIVILKHKLLNLLDGIEIGFFDTAKNWGEETNDYYFKYFNDKDKDLRSLSILAFTAMLGNWYNGPAFVFRAPPLPHKQFYFIEDYLPPFLENAVSINEEFPVLYSYTLFYLYELDKRKGFENVFPFVDHNLFNQMRSQLFNENGKDVLVSRHSKLPAFNSLLREVGLPTFFSD